MSGGGGGSGKRESREASELHRTQADIARKQWDAFEQLGLPLAETIAGEALNTPQIQYASVPQMAAYSDPGSYRGASYTDAGAWQGSYRDPGDWQGEWIDPGQLAAYTDAGAWDAEFEDPGELNLAERARLDPTALEYNRAASEAGAGALQSHQQAQGQLRRQLARYGINPASGRFAGTLRNAALAQAADVAGARAASARPLEQRILQRGTIEDQRNLARAGLESQHGLARAGQYNQFNAQRMNYGLARAGQENQYNIARGNYNLGRSGQSAQYDSMQNQYNLGRSGQQAQYDAARNQYQLGRAGQANQFSLADAAGRNQFALSRAGMRNAYNAQAAQFGLGRAQYLDARALNEADRGYNRLLRGYGALFRLGGAASAGLGQAASGLGAIGANKAQQRGQFWNSVGQAAGVGAGLYFSDRRLKRDVVQIGTLPNGVPVYEFAYTWDPETRHHGCMADELEHVLPGVVGECEGFKTVDYAALNAAIAA